MSSFVGITAIILGLIGLFASDLAWKYQEFRNKQIGINSERPDDWDNSSFIGGVLFVIIGSVILLAPMIFGE